MKIWDFLKLIFWTKADTPNAKAIQAFFRFMFFLGLIFVLGFVVVILKVIELIFS